MRWLGYCIALFIILAATAVSMSQLLTPYLNEHRADFSMWASDLLNVPITINQVKISWRRVEPEIVLQQVAVLNKQTRKPTVKIQKIKVNIKIIQSLLQRKLLPENIKIYGVHLTLHQKKSGQLHVEGLDNFVFMDNFTGGSVAGNAMGAWIFSQSNLTLRNIEIEFIPEVGPQRSVTLASLDLHNTRTQHELTGQATLNQAIPTQVAINLQWQGDTSDIMHSTSRVHLYLYLEDISLSQWISRQTWQKLQVKQGSGSGKFWITWDHGQLQNVQSQFQLYEIQLQSLITKKIAIISRINGHLGWQRDSARQLIEGKDILIDFPQHLWPTTEFSLTLLPADHATAQPPLKRKMGGYRLQMGYFDLADTKELALASGLLPESIQKLLLDLNPKGEVRSLSIQSDELTKLENSHYSAEFSNLSVNSWQTFPGLMNMSGKISWDGKQGNVTFNSQKTIMTLNSVFAKPLQFDTVSGDIQWQKNETSAWLINAKNFQMNNADITVNADMTLRLPKDESPTLNLSGEFSVPHAAQIENYLPVKKLESPFVQWLHNRFQGGELTSGKVTVQGKLSDFPFEKGTGIFLVSTRVKDLEFEYAPGWPIVHHVYGNLVFSGHSMTADAESAQLFDVPLTKVHGYIPYIGPAHPQILDLQAIIHADLEQGLRFIQESPLRNTIGKDLAGMQLSGAMGLKLAFTIPVKTPEKSAVLGDVTVSAALLQLPSWHLTLDRMAGILHFTEQSVQTTQMQGRLFDEAVSLNINTVRPSHSPPVVKAVLQSKISQPLLEKWLNIPLSQFIQGAAPYTAELDIISHQYLQPSRLFIHSDLTGLSINLPEIYAKKPDEPRDFQLIANVKQDQPIQAKLTYGKLLTAAFTYEKSTQGWQFQGGELRLGHNGQANWQSQPGILVTGQMNKLDWNKWHAYFSSLSLNKNNKKTESDSLMHYLRGIDIQANQFPVLGQNLTRVRVQAMQEENSWKINVTSPEMTGQVWLPIHDVKSVIHAKFQHLYLISTDEKQLLDPKTIPAISFVGEDVRYKNKYIGHVILDVAPNKEGLQIQKLNISTDFFTLNAEGKWSLQKNRNQTILQGDLNTKNVSQLLDHWDLGSANLIAGEGHITFDLNWLDIPYNPVLATLSGSLFLKLGKGRVINLGNSTDAKLGFGRMLNILSLQTLPRRLSLDFTDLFEKGYSFDTMQGHFNLEHGSANTKDTYFDGPIARIEIKGKIGMAAKDYDLILSVTPYVTGSIPIVATLAGGPVVGAVTWLVEKVASSVVSKVTTYHYSVRGPWDNPVWEQTKGL